MLRNFNEIENYLLLKNIVKKVILMEAYHEYALSAIVKAKRKGLIHCILVGNRTKIESILNIIGESINEYEIIDSDDSFELSLFTNEKTNICIISNIEMNKEFKQLESLIETNSILNECTVLECDSLNKFIFISDTSINAQPNLKQKIRILRNTVELAKCSQLNYIKVGVLSNSNQLNTLDQNSLDAYALSKVGWSDCLIEGPITLNNAIKSNKNYFMDVLLCPNVYVGNAICNTLKCFSNQKQASLLLGTKNPIININVYDTEETIYHSLLIAMLK